MTAESTTQPVLEVTPRKIKIYAWCFAVVLVVGHAFVAWLLKAGGDSGIAFKTGDQAGMVGIGLILAGGALLFARPRLRLGPDGVTVRNLLNENTYPWGLVDGFTFPEGAQFAHLELPQDEYVAIWAIQARDGEHAVQSLDRARELAAHYRA
ncbi:PH domain-containing protein [Tsukamurella sp. PLM1]|uniref:PH domain-containing protein n=1 Tax=Tsukamurella sp. PLM1 TaxID=2929795 RepID=UPI002060CC05|nr:PH domain-containing protein [Tsukamurella sp. PLM1]BDH57962.1 membrane protein [Tsukamurella sp. PLM1]